MAWGSGEAQMVLSADTSALKSGMARARRMMLGMRKSMGRVAAGIGRSLKVAFAAGAVGAAAAATGIGYAVKQASDAQETLSRFRQVFGEQAAAAGAWADDLAEAVGRSKFAVKDALTTYQGFFVGLGFGSRKAAEMSQKMQRLATDFASFHNLTDAEATQRFISALSGSAEVLDRFGVNIKQAALDQELLKMGIEDGVKAATEQQKALARMNVVMRAMTQQGAVGDAVRTADELANQWRRTRAALHDTVVEIGQAFMPIAGKVLEQIRAMVDWLKQFGDVAKQVFFAALQVAKEYFGALGDWLASSEAGGKALITVIGEKLRDAFLMAAYVVKNLGKIFGWAFTWGKGQLLAFKDTFVGFFTQDIPELWDWFRRNWKALMKDVADLWIRYTKGYLAFWLQSFTELFEWISSGFKDKIDWQAPVREFAKQIKGFKRRTEELPGLFDSAMSESTKRVLKRADDMFSGFVKGWDAYRAEFLSQFEEEEKAKKKAGKQDEKALDVAEKRKETEEETAEAVERQKAAFIGLTQLWKNIAGAAMAGPENNAAAGRGGGTGGGTSAPRAAKQSKEMVQLTRRIEANTRLLRKGLPAIAT